MFLPIALFGACYMVEFKLYLAMLRTYIVNNLADAT